MGEATSREEDGVEGPGVRNYHVENMLEAGDGETEDSRSGWDRQGDITMLQVTFLLLDLRWGKKKSQR